MTTPTTETGIVEKVARAIDAATGFYLPRDDAVAAARAAIAAMPDSTQLLQTMAGALETCLAMGERELKRSMNLNGDSPYDIGIAALAQFRAQERRS